MPPQPNAGDRFTDDLVGTYREGDWTTKDLRMLALLDEEGIHAWQAHIDKQLTREDIAGWSGERVAEARADGRLDKLLFDGE